MSKVKKYSREIEQTRRRATKLLGKSNDEIERQEFMLDQKKKASIGQEKKYKDEIHSMQAALKNLHDKQRQAQDGFHQKSQTSLRGLNKYSR